MDALDAINAGFCPIGIVLYCHAVENMDWKTQTKFPDTGLLQLKRRCFGGSFQMLKLVPKVLKVCPGW